MAIARRATLNPVRCLFSQRIPPGRILFVESGSREITERLLPVLYRNHNAPIDLFTCFPGVPNGLPPDAAVFRTGDHQGHSARRRLYRQLRARRYALLGMLCSGEPIMAKWKWAVVSRVPAKVFIVNENADYFWLDYAHRSILLHFAFLRSGLTGTGGLRTLARLAAFPFTLAWLLAYAAWVHSRRALRLLAHPSLARPR
jgi:hypothetical protein